MRVAPALAFFTSTALGLFLAGCGGVAKHFPGQTCQEDKPFIACVAPAEAGRSGEAQLDASPEEGLRRQRMAEGVASNAEIEAYLNGVLHKIQLAWPGEPKPARVFIKPSSDFAAYSTKDGAIFIPFFLIQAMKSEDEAAALLAHEYSHVLLGHAGLGDQEKAVKVLYGLSSVALAVSGNAQSKDGVLTHLLANESVLFLGQSAVLPAYGREQEAEADSLGVDLMMRAGYNPSGMVDLLKNLENSEQRDATREKERRERLEALLTADKSSDASKALEKAVASLLEKGMTAAMDAVNKMRQTHYPASERRKAVNDYLDKFYEDAPQPAMSLANWTSSVECPSAKSFFATLEGACDMRSAMLDNDWAKARKIGSNLNQDVVRQAALARMAMTQLETAKSSGDALNALDAATQSPDSLYIEHVDFINAAERKSPKIALAALERANQTFKDPPALLPAMIRLQNKNGNKTAASLYLVRCVMEGDKTLMEECSKASK